MGVVRRVRERRRGVGRCILRVLMGGGGEGGGESCRAPAREAL